MCVFDSRSWCGRFFLMQNHLYISFCQDIFCNLSWNMSGLACSCRMRACPPISYPRRWLCSLPWHPCVHVRWVIGQELTVWVSHPNLLCALLIHKRCVVVFYRCSRFHCFWETNCQMQEKRMDHCEMTADCSFAENLPPKMRLFFAFVKLPNHWLFGIPR